MLLVKDFFFSEHKTYLPNHIPITDRNDRYVHASPLRMWPMCSPQEKNGGQEVEEGRGARESCILTTTSETTIVSKSTAKICIKGLVVSVGAYLHCDESS